MKNKIVILIVLAIAVVASVALIQKTEAQTRLFPYQGGTGATSTPSAGTILVGVNASRYGLLAIGANGLCLVASSTATLGVSWESCGAGITSLNGSTSSTQTFAVASSSNTLSIGTSNGVHTFTFPNNLAWFTNDANFITLSSLSAVGPLLSYNSGTGAFSTTYTPASSTLTLTAGAGLTGGGDLSANRTFTVGAGTNIVVNADDVAVSLTPTFTSVVSTNASSTNLEATSSLKVAGNTVRGENTIGADFLNTTTTVGENFSEYIFRAQTAQEFVCSTEGTSIIFGADERASSTPNTHGTNVFLGNGTVTCDSDGFSTTTFANAGIAAQSLFTAYASSTIGNSTTTLHWDFRTTYD